MIYDCFLFNNELEILDIRLHELDSVVDKFVLVESTVTHSGKPKELFFKKNKDLFKIYKNKILHIIIKDTPKVTLPWIINDYQFSQLKRGLIKCTPNDIIIFGDVDEIPKAEKILEWKNKPGQLKVFKQVLSYYHLYYIDKDEECYGTRMTLLRHIQSYPTMWIAKYSIHDIKIQNGGWHFSYIGGVKRIQHKLDAMTHQEINVDKYNSKEHILKEIARGQYFAGTGRKLTISSSETLPQYINENLDHFTSLLVPKTSFLQKILQVYFPYLTLKKTVVLLTRKSRIKLGKLRRKIQYGILSQ